MTNCEYLNFVKTLFAIVEAYLYKCYNKYIKEYYKTNMSSDIMALQLNSQLMDSALSFNPTVNSALTAVTPVKGNVASASQEPAQVSDSSSEQGVYAIKGDSKYKEEMDANTDGVITNAEMSQYYAKLANDYGDNIASLQNKSVGNVATTSQATNAYMANEAAFSAGYMSLINVSA